MERNKAKELAVLIFNYSYACYNLGEEGNSGEFSDARDHKHLEKEVEINFQKLVTFFKELTGFSISRDAESNIFFDDEFLINNSMY